MEALGGRPALVGALLGFLYTAAWIPRMDGPWDWDPSYYFSVARHLWEGDGAVTGAVWNLGWLPERVVHPADLHWSPVPSRWILPFFLLPIEPWRAAQLASAVLSIGWGLLGGGWAALLGASSVGRGLAALLAAAGGGYAGYLVLPDSIATFGAVGGGALLAAAMLRAGVGAPRRLTVILAVLCGLAAVTRTDGAILAMACAFGLSRVHAAAAIVPAALTTAAWTLRGVLVAGDGPLALRARAVHATDAVAWLLPRPVPELSLDGRLGFLLTHGDALLRTWLVPSLVVGVPLLLVGAARSRLALPGLLYALVLPPLLYLLVPAVAFEGSGFRSLAATWPLQAALIVVGAERIGRRYHPAFVPGLVVAGILALAVRAGADRFPQPAEDCAALTGVPAGAPVLSYDPPGLEARCGHPGVVLARGLTQAEVDALAERYGLEWMLAAAPGMDTWSPGPAEVAYEGWTQVGPRLWRRAPGP